MGVDPEKVLRAEPGEGPPRTVVLSEYGIQRFPVTVSEWRSFIENTGYRWPWTDWAERTKLMRVEHDLPENYPVTYVDWSDCNAYAKWRTTTEFEYRLPTEAEWEYACRGRKDALMPWENLTAASAFDADLEQADGRVLLHPVGHQPHRQSFFGCEEMWCNIQEWCLDDWSEELLQGGASSVWRNTESEQKAIRGGGWWMSGYPRCSARRGHRHDFRHETLGFRLVRVTHAGK